MFLFLKSTQQTVTRYCIMSQDVTLYHKMSHYITRCHMWRWKSENFFIFVEWFLLNFVSRTLIRVSNEIWKLVALTILL